MGSNPAGRATEKPDVLQDIRFFVGRAGFEAAACKAVGERSKRQPGGLSGFAGSAVNESAETSPGRASLRGDD